MGENKSILWKGLAIFLGVNFLEVLIFVVFGVDYSKIMIVWFAEKAVILFAGGEILIQMKRLQEGGKHIAEGDMDYQDRHGTYASGTKRTCGRFKPHQ